MKQFTSTRLFRCHVRGSSHARRRMQRGRTMNPPATRRTQPLSPPRSARQTTWCSSRAANTVWDVDDCIGISTSSVNGEDKTMSISATRPTAVCSAPYPVRRAKTTPSTFRTSPPRPSPLTTPTRARTAPARQRRHHHERTHRRRPEPGEPARHRLPLGAADSPKQQPEGRFPVFTPHEPPPHPELQGGCRNSAPEQADLHPHPTGDGGTFPPVKPKPQARCPNSKTCPPPPSGDRSQASPSSGRGR